MNLYLLFSLICILSQSFAFSDYWRRHRQWNALKRKLNSLKTASEEVETPDLHRIWLKRNGLNPFWRLQDRIWLKKKSDRKVDRLSEEKEERKKKNVAEVPLQWDNNEMDGESFLNIVEDVRNVFGSEGPMKKFPGVKEEEEEEEDGEEEQEKRGGLRYDVTLDSAGKLQLYWDIGELVFNLI